MHPTTRPCRICGNSEDNARHTVREMMFGTREAFEYIECAFCGCLQIGEVPENLSDYYPSDYYSFGTPKQPGPIKIFFRRVWAKHHMDAPSLVGRLLTYLYGRAPFFEWTRRAGVSFDSSILDVGAGRGALVIQMYSCGFRHVTGIDPYIEADITYAEGARVLKCDLAEVEGTFDFIMAHHVLEHVPDPLVFLRDVLRLLKPEGSILIRTPVASSWAWRHYGTDWVALDAPRHLFVHTEKSMALLAHEVGLSIQEVVWDSTAMQFWASEQYRRDIPLMDPRSYRQNPRESFFTEREMRVFQGKADALNARGEGDTAAFYLCRG